jgi:hypothetical protein
LTGLAPVLLGALLLGWLVDRACLGDPGLGAVERLGRALMLGLGSLGALSMALDAWGLPVVLPALLGAAGLLVLLLVWPASRARRPPGREVRAPPTVLVRVLVGLLLVLALVSVGQAVFSGLVRPTFQFDSLTRWMFKTKVLALEGTLIGPLSQDPEFAFTHQRYPPLVSHVSVWPCLVEGRFDDRLAQSIYPWYAVALVMVLFGALRRRVGPLRASLGAAWVAGFPLLSFVPYPPPGSGAASAMADIPLALFVTGAGLALIDALERARDRAHVETALLLGFAVLTKNEGLPVAAVVVVLLLLLTRRGRWRTALGVAALVGAVYWLLWGRLAAELPALDEHYPGQLRLGAVLAGLPRLPRILLQFGHELISFRSWNLTWPAVVALLALGRWSRPVGVLVTIVVAQLGVYVIAFVITAWSSPAAEFLGGDPVDYLMTLTVGRLFMHVAPLAVVAALLASPALAPAASRPAERAPSES